MSESLRNTVSKIINASLGSDRVAIYSRALLKTLPILALTPTPFPFVSDSDIKEITLHRLLRLSLNDYEPLTLGEPYHNKVFFEGSRLAVERFRPQGKNNPFQDKVFNTALFDQVLLKKHLLDSSSIFSLAAYLSNVLMVIDDGNNHWLPDSDWDVFSRFLGHDDHLFWSIKDSTLLDAELIEARQDLSLIPLWSDDRAPKGWHKSVNALEKWAKGFGDDFDPLFKSYRKAIRGQ